MECSIILYVLEIQNETIKPTNTSSTHFKSNNTSKSHFLKRCIHPWHHHRTLFRTNFDNFQALGQQHSENPGIDWISWGAYFGKYARFLRLQRMKKHPYKTLRIERHSYNLSEGQENVHPGSNELKGNSTIASYWIQQEQFCSLFSSTIGRGMFL